MILFGGIPMIQGTINVEHNVSWKLFFDSSCFFCLSRLKHQLFVFFFRIFYDARRQSTNYLSIVHCWNRKNEEQLLTLHPLLVEKQIKMSFSACVQIFTHQQQPFYLKSLFVLNWYLSTESVIICSSNQEYNSSQSLFAAKQNVSNYFAHCPSLFCIWPTAFAAGCNTENITGAPNTFPVDTSDPVLLLVSRTVVYGWYCWKRLHVPPPRLRKQQLRFWVCCWSASCTSNERNPFHCMGVLRRSDWGRHQRHWCRYNIPQYWIDKISQLGLRRRWICKMISVLLSWTSNLCGNAWYCGCHRPFVRHDSPHSLDRWDYSRLLQFVWCLG